MNALTIAVNTAMFDGHDTETAFQTIRECGFSAVELAYNQGYVGNISPALFSDENADNINALLERYQLTTHALGATMNLGGRDAIEQFRLRIRFASLIGAECLTVCIGAKTDRDIIVNNLRELAPLAADHGCIICIENGGDPNYGLFSLAQDGCQLLDEIGHPAVAFNIDAGNLVSLCPDVDPIAETLAMLPWARHCHIKDVERRDDEFWFPAIGSGELDFEPLLQAMEGKNIPCSLEIPLRMHRQNDTLAVRSDHPVSLDTIRRTLRDSRSTLQKWLTRVVK